MAQQCYVGQWRLYNQNGTRRHFRTIGYYYFADRQPFYPGKHNLWHLEWVDQNHPYDDGLGPVVGAPITYIDGQWDGDFPWPKLIGSPDCIQLGETGPSVNPEEFREGLPAACWIQAGSAITSADLSINPFYETTTRIPLPVLPQFRPVVREPFPPIAPQLPAFDDLASYAYCPIQRFWAAIIQLVYYFRDADLAAIADRIWQGTQTVRFDRHQELRVGTWIVKAPEALYVAIDGTFPTFPLEFLVQAYNWLTPLDTQGGVSVSAIYRTNAQNILNRITNLNPITTKRMFICGHSFGAATAQVLASMVRAANPDWDIRYLLFASPKAGDESLRTALKTCRGLPVNRVDDVIPLLPPKPTDPTAWAVGIVSAARIFWQGFQPHKHPQFIDANGQIIRGRREGVYTNVFRQAVQWAWNGGDLPVLRSHPIARYYDSITSRCPLPAYPMTRQILNIINAAGVLALGGDNLLAPAEGTLEFSGMDALPSINGGLRITGGDTSPPSQGSLHIGGP